jgi:hypothetical protein
MLPRIPEKLSGYDLIPFILQPEQFLEYSKMAVKSLFTVNLNDFTWVNNPDDYLVAVNENNALKIFELRKYQKDLLIKASSLPKNSKKEYQTKDDMGYTVDVVLFVETIKYPFDYDGQNYDYEHIFYGFTPKNNPQNKRFFIRKPIKYYDEPKHIILNYKPSDIYIYILVRKPDGSYDAYSELFAQHKLLKLNQYPYINNDNNIEKITLNVDKSSFSHKNTSNSSYNNIGNYVNNNLVISNIKPYQKLILEKISSISGHSKARKFLYDYLDDNNQALKVWIYINFKASEKLTTDPKNSDIMKDGYLEIGYYHADANELYSHIFIRDRDLQTFVYNN